MNYLIVAWLGGAAMLIAALIADPFIRKYGSKRMVSWWKRNVIKDVSDMKVEI